MDELEALPHRRLIRFFDTMGYLAKRFREAAIIALLISFLCSVFAGHEGPFFPTLIAALVLAFMADMWTFIRFVIERSAKAS